FRLHARQWVRRAPGIPCALFFRGRCSQDPDANRAAGMRMAGCLKIKFDVVPGKRATRARPGNHNHRTMSLGEIETSSLRKTKAGGYGSPEFTNEVQHFLAEVLPWGGSTSSYPLMIDARLPVFRPMAARSGKSRQLWSARH